MLAHLTDPTLWLAVAAWLLLLVPTLAMCRAAARGDRMAERARQDAQARARTFAAWDAEVDRVWPTQVIAIPADLMDHDGLGTA